MPDDAEGPPVRTSFARVRSPPPSPLALLPEMGTIVPEMGTVAVQPRNGLADALFSPAQQRVLGLLFGQPERAFRSAEIIRLAESGTGTVHRFLQRLERAGLVESRRVGNQKHYQASRSCPIFPELSGLVMKTVGLAGPLRDALQPRAADIRAAFIYGSVAKGTATAGSDVDVLIVSDEIRYPEAHELLAPAGERIGRTVSPTIMTSSGWRRDAARRDGFATRILAGPRIFLVGSDGDLR